MSSIIDALKKSEKDRHSGDTAAVNAIKFGHNQPPKSRKGFWLLVVVLLLIAAAVFAWQQGWHQAIMAQFNPVTEAQTPTTQTAPAETTPKAEQAIDQETINEVAENTLKLVPPATETIKNHRAAAKEKQSDKASTAIAASQDNGPSETLEMQPENTKEQIIALTAASEQPASAQNEAALSSTKQQEKDQQAMRRPAQQSTTTDTLKQDYLLVHQVPFEIRKNIPPIKLNIHIYDPEPENRMVLLNGAKYGVGDVIEEMVEVKDITQEGVVLKFETIEFLVPK